MNRFKSLTKDLKRRFPEYSYQITNGTIIIVSAAKQKLFLIKNQTVVSIYTISTAKAGFGNKSESYQTPLGLHRIAEKIGHKATIGSIFKARKNTERIADIILDPKLRSNEDNITSRILWLEGLEDGINKGIDQEGSKVDSFSRYIYIHGTDEENLLGQAASHGCVRMGNNDVIELFDLVQTHDLVFITKE